MIADTIIKLLKKAVGTAEPAEELLHPFKVQYLVFFLTSIRLGNKALNEFFLKHEQSLGGLAQRAVMHVYMDAYCMYMDACIWIQYT